MSKPASPESNKEEVWGTIVCYEGLRKERKGKEEKREENRKKGEGKEKRRKGF